MRYASVASAIAILAVLPTALLQAASVNSSEFLSRAEVMEWMESYRQKPAPARVPDAVKALSKSGALRDPETAGFYVGFVAGVLGTNPYDAERLIGRMLPLPPGDQWFLVRALAYSGLPSWKSLLRRTVERLPAKRSMADAYLDGTLPTLDAIELDKDPTFLERLGQPLGIKQKTPEVSFGHNPELVDTLWGQISPRANTVRSRASLRCCRGRRSATTASGLRSAARRNTRSPTTPRAIPISSR